MVLPSTSTEAFPVTPELLRLLRCACTVVLCASSWCAAVLLPVATAVPPKAAVLRSAAPPATVAARSLIFIDFLRVCARRLRALPRLFGAGSVTDWSPSLDPRRQAASAGSTPPSRPAGRLGRPTRCPARGRSARGVERRS